MKLFTVALLTLITQAIAASVPVQNAARDLIEGSYPPRTTRLAIHTELTLRYRPRNHRSGLCPSRIRGETKGACSRIWTFIGLRKRRIACPIAQTRERELGSCRRCRRYLGPGCPTPLDRPSKRSQWGGGKLGRI